MLVDTGATVTKIPESIANRLGILPAHQAEVQLADGRVVVRGESEAQVELDGRRRTIPVLIGPDQEEPLLGLTTLEILKLKVNPVTQRLEPAKWIEYSLTH